MGRWLLAAKVEFHARQYFQRIGLSRLERLLRKQVDQKIVSGPFKGMHYLSEATGSVWAPKILGTYEQELHSIVEDLVHHRPDVFLDLGCAEGYYAVGIALRIPDGAVVAADSNPLARARVRLLARRNGVEDRVRITGEWAVRNWNRCCRSPTDPFCGVTLRVVSMNSFVRR